MTQLQELETYVHELAMPDTVQGTGLLPRAAVMLSGRWTIVAQHRWGGDDPVVGIPAARFAIVMEVDFGSCVLDWSEA